MSLEYSTEHVTDITRIGGKDTAIGKESYAKLIHPVLRIFKDIPERRINKALIDEIHFDEDLLAKFDDKFKYIDKLTRTLKMFIN